MLFVAKLMMKLARKDRKRRILTVRMCSKETARRSVPWTTGKTLIPKAVESPRECD